MRLLSSPEPDADTMTPIFKFNYTPLGLLSLFVLVAFVEQVDRELLQVHERGIDYDSWNVHNLTLKQHRRLDEPNDRPEQPQLHDQPRKLRILYVMTTLAEYDSGGRATKRGFDRLKSSMIPVLRTGVESMVSYGFDVDVFLVCHYSMRSDRFELVRRSLPESVGLQVWNDSTPLAYRIEPNAKKVVPYTLALARQHRFVVKDKLFDYDFFVNFEDDMVIKGEHVRNYLEITQDLFRLRDVAPDDDDNLGEKFYGFLTKSKLKRMFPGLIRVEVLLDEKSYGTQQRLDPVPITDRPHLDPAPCCHLPSHASSQSRPESPESDKIFLWEVGIKALGVRKMPDLGQSTDENGGTTVSRISDQWFVMQRGPKFTERNLTIGDYWSGSEGYFKGEKGGGRRPQPMQFDHVNNQGGWMATQQQIFEWHTEICPGGFLPPYDKPHFNFDGLDMRNVEYWSGGLSLVTKRHACNLQRIISLDPERFTRSLIYHAANNKQRQLHGKRERFVKVNDLLGQLYTVRNDAQKELQRQMQQNRQ